MDAAALIDHSALEFRSDLLDAQIYICSPLVGDFFVLPLTLCQVLHHFTDNFDYLDIQNDFIGGVLGDAVLGNRIFTYIATKEYAARVNDIRTYDSVSKDVICRWTYPIVPDNNWWTPIPSPFGQSLGTYRFARGNIYKELPTDAHSGVRMARSSCIFLCFLTLNRSCTLERDSVIGGGTVIGAGSSIHTSVIGRNVQIGDGVSIHGSYIWDNVEIQDNVVVDCALIASGVKLLRVLPQFLVVLNYGLGQPGWSRMRARIWCCHW